MAGKKGATIKDIARAVGVHPSTVSRALKMGSKTPPSPDVVERILAAAAELGYQPNRIAASLRTSRSMLVGIMVTDMADPLFPPIVRGMESVLEPLGYNSLIVNTDDDPARAARLLQVLRERGVDGILNGAVLQEDRPTVTAMEQGLPIITFNRRLANGLVPSVVSDQEEGCASVINHLYGLGHRRIALICGPQDKSTGLVRAQASIAALKSLGIEPPAHAVAFARSWKEDEGKRCAVAILGSTYEPTAIVCSNDRLAIGALRELKMRRIPCPERVSITGYNDSLNVDLLEPPLTTVRVLKHEMGAVAARTLLDLLDSPEASEAPQVLHSVIPTELIVRRSSGPAPT